MQGHLAEVEASAKRVADVTVGRIMRRQQLFETRFAAYAAVAAAEGGKRVFPKPSPGPPRKTIAQEQAPKPPQAAAGGAGRGNGKNPPVLPANGGYPDDWDKYLNFTGTIEEFDLVDWFYNPHVQEVIFDYAEKPFQKHRYGSKRKGSTWSPDIATYEHTVEILERSLRSEVERGIDPESGAWVFEFVDPLTGKSFRIALDQNSPIVLKSIHPNFDW